MPTHTVWNVPEEHAFTRTIGRHDRDAMKLIDVECMWNAG